MYLLRESFAGKLLRSKRGWEGGMCICVSIVYICSLFLIDALMIVNYPLSAFQCAKG